MTETSKDVATRGEYSSALEEFKAGLGEGAIPGLETVREEDLALPIIQIDHKKNRFVDKLTGTEYESLDCVLLGLLKQRVMWPADPDSKDGLLCKSQDAVTGNPREKFPWAEFKKGDGPEPIGADHIACDSCTFAKWGSHPKNDTPWCSLQHVYPVIIGEGESVSGLLTLQRSALKPSNGYISGFVREGRPMFTVRTSIGLNSNRNGSVDFSTPTFKRGEPVAEDVTLWRRWAKEYKAIEALLLRFSGGDAAVVSESETTPPVSPEDTAKVIDSDVF
jgi:hypothetical protein